MFAGANERELQLRTGCHLHLDDVAIGSCACFACLFKSTVDVWL